MTSRKFCCCIPVRIAVFLSSLTISFTSLATVAVSVLLFLKAKRTHAPKDERIAIIVLGVIYLILSFASILGLMGAILRKRRLVAIYSTTLFILLLLTAGASGYAIYILLRNRDNNKTCIPNVNGTDSCLNTSPTTRWTIIFGLIVILSIQLYVTIVVRRYVKQLDDEQRFDRASAYANELGMEPTRGRGAYYAYQLPEEQANQALLHPQGYYQAHAPEGHHRDQSLSSYQAPSTVYVPTLQHSGENSYVPHGSYVYADSHHSFGNTPVHNPTPP